MFRDAVSRFFRELNRPEAKVAVLVIGTIWAVSDALDGDFGTMEELFVPKWFR